MPRPSATHMAHLVVALRSRQIIEALEAILATALIDIASDDQDTVTQAALLVSLADKLLAEIIVWERQRGTSWSELGHALGVRRQTVHERYRDDEQRWFRLINSAAVRLDNEPASDVIRNHRSVEASLRQWWERRRSANS